MADAKKTVTKKVSTAKKKAATTAKKTTKKVASTAKKASTTAKKTTKKATTTAKKVTKKTTATAKKTTRKVTTKAKKLTPPKKTTARVLEAAYVGVLTWADWKSLLGQSFTNFKALWWRLVVIILLTLLLLAVFSAIGVYAIIALGGGMISLESEIANLYAGTPDLNFLGSFLGVIVLMTLVWIIISMISRLAMLLTLKNHRAKKPNNPVKVLFEQAWPYFWRYAWLTVRMIWFVLWPVAILMVIASVLLWFIATKGVLTESLETAFFIILVMVGIALIIWRLVPMMLVDATLVQGNKSANLTFSKARQLVVGHWWKVFAAIFVFLLFTIVVQTWIEGYGVQYTSTGDMIPPTNSQLAMTGLANVLSIFVFGPFAVCYIYNLVLHLSASKKINL